MKIENELLKQPEFIELNGVKFFPEKQMLNENSWVSVDRGLKSDQKALVFFKFGEEKTYGFTHNGKWSENYGNGADTFSNPNYKYTYPEESEVLEALTKEAVKRGYKKGNHKCLNSPIVENCLEDVYSLEAGKLWYGGKYANCVFYKGKWAEIIPTISKEEAEKQLGKKIID